MTVPNAQQRHRALAEMSAMISQDFGIASSCFYCYADPAGQLVKGRTVRFAELAASFWGGVESESRPVAIGPKMVRVHTTCREVERNISATVEIETPVEHGETSKAVQLASAIGYRVAVFRVIPALLFEKPFQAAIDCATGQGRGKRRAGWVINQLRKKFPDLKTDQLLGIAGKPTVEALTVADLSLLVGRSNYHETSVKERAISPNEFVQ